MSLTNSPSFDGVAKERMVPRYYFDVINCAKLHRDLFGVDLADDDEARDEAIALVHALPQDRLPEGDRHQFVARARNEGGEIVYEASLTLYGSWWPS